MPNHVHALIWLEDSRNLTRFLHGWKRMRSFRIRRWYEMRSPNYFADFGRGDHFWQGKSYIFHVTTERKLQQKLDYMHLNPVRAGLVERASDYRWSSARWYIDHKPVGVRIASVD